HCQNALCIGDAVLCVLDAVELHFPAPLCCVPNRTVLLQIAGFYPLALSAILLTNPNIPLDWSTLFMRLLRTPIPSAVAGMDAVWFRLWAPDTHIITEPYP